MFMIILQNIRFKKENLIKFKTEQNRTAEKAILKAVIEDQCEIS